MTNFFADSFFIPMIIFTDDWFLQTNTFTDIFLETRTFGIF